MLMASSSSGPPLDLLSELVLVRVAEFGFTGATMLEALMSYGGIVRSSGLGFVREESVVGFVFTTGLPSGPWLKPDLSSMAKTLPPCDCDSSKSTRDYADSSMARILL